VGDVADGGEGLATEAVRRHAREIVKSAQLGRREASAEDRQVGMLPRSFNSSVSSDFCSATRGACRKQTMAVDAPGCHSRRLGSGAA
jgi:hypothetical protein